MSDGPSYSDVQEYLSSLVPSRPDEMLAMEAEARKTGFPIIGPAAGHLCYQIARMMDCRNIFELGSGYGYSTAWFAKAVAENGGGTVHHAVWDEELSNQARKHLGRLGYEGIVQYHVGEAVEALSATPGPFDLIFNDIHKESYPASLDVINEKLKPGGVLIVDNTLWSGRVYDSHNEEASTQGVREITRLLTQDRGWIVSIVPTRDGVLVAYRL